MGLAATNTSLGWIGTAASPFHSVYAIHVKQKALERNVCDLIEQVNIVGKRNKLGKTVVYPGPTDKKQHKLSTLLFANTSRRGDCGHLEFPLICLSVRLKTALFIMPSLGCITDHSARSKMYGLQIYLLLLNSSM